MVIYWHPVLAQLLREVYGDRLDIQEEVNLGELPLRIDLVIIRRDPAVALPYPFEHLGATTLLSFKGPKETAGQISLQELEIYGLLYQLKFKLPRRRDLTLWLVASKVARGVSQRSDAYLASAREVGPGVRAGDVDGFPTCLVNLNQLPVEAATWPLVMVSQGPAERKLVEYFLKHPRTLSQHGRQLMELHAEALLEVVKMNIRDRRRQAGITDPKRFVEMLVEVFGGEEELFRLLGEEKVARALGEERIVHALGEERIVHALGEERIVHALGEERVLQTLIQQFGAEQLQQMIQRLAKQASRTSQSPKRKKVSGRD